MPFDVRKYAKDNQCVEQACSLKDDDIYLNNSIFKRGGIIGRKNFLFFLLIIYASFLVVEHFIYLISNSPNITYFISFAGTCMILYVQYISTEKRLLDLEDKKPCWYKIIFYMLPILCIYPLWAEGKYAIKLEKEKYKNLKKNSVFNLDGIINGKQCILNCGCIIFLSITAFFIITNNNNFLKETYSSRDYLYILCLIVQMMIFNFIKYHNYRKSGFLYGRSPDSEQIEPAGVKLRRRNSVSVEEIQDER